MLIIAAITLRKKNRGQRPLPQRLRVLLQDSIAARGCSGEDTESLVQSLWERQGKVANVPAGIAFLITTRVVAAIPYRPKHLN